MDEEPIDAEYVLPLRWATEEFADVAEYLERLVRWVDVTVVDGSDDPAFERHEREWPSAVRHVRPAGAGRNGKAVGAMTGIRVARHDVVVIADDDVRYTREQLADIVRRLGDAELVRPQNVFAPTPWHARWDTGRSLLNRALGGDFAGTTALRRSALPSAGYDTDVLFENLELERTVRANGGRIAVARDLFVARRPPAPSKFWEQRVRQAYDDFGQPLRLARELSILPVIALLLWRRRWGMLALGVAGVVGLAERGRRRDGGRAVYAPTASLWSVPWMLERGVTVWPALVARARGGVVYRDGRLATAAHSVRWIRRALRDADGRGPSSSLCASSVR